ncbi:hypothetical protein [Tessaracoccus sp. Z1128]
MDDWSTLEGLSDEHCEALLVALDKPQNVVHIGELSDELGWTVNDAVDVVRDLRGSGLAERDTSAAGEMTLSARGRRITRMLRDSRVSGVARRDAVQGALLQWLVGHREYTHLVGFFGHDDASAFGSAFSDDEIREAAEYLGSKGLIETLGTRQVGVLRARITPDGCAAAAAGRRVSHVLGMRHAPASYVDNRADTYIANSTVGAVQSGGTGNVQHVTMSLSSDQRAQVVNEVSELIRQLDAADLKGAEPVRSALEAVRVEAQAGTKESLGHKILAAVSAAFCQRDNQVRRHRPAGSGGHRGLMPSALRGR